MSKPAAGQWESFREEFRRLRQDVRATCLERDRMAQALRNIARVVNDRYVPETPPGLFAEILEEARRGLGKEESP